MKKRDALFCTLIFAYCMVVGLFTLKLQLIKADAALPAVVAAQSVVTEPVRFEATPDSPDPNQVFDLVNKERAANGSPVLVANAKLAKVAAERAADMAQRQYYAHKSPDGLYYYDLFPSEGIDVDYSCENLDITFVPDISQFINEWSASLKGHRECMNNPKLTQAGYAVTKMMLLEYGGKQVPAYLVVAIHSTEIVR